MKGVLHNSNERMGRRAGLVSILGAIGLGRLSAQFGRSRPERLPNGRNRDLLLIKKDHEKTLEEVSEIRRLATEVETELEENTEHVLSLTSIAKVEKIEDLAKSARKRMRRFY